MEEAERLEPGGAYCLSLHFKSLGLSDREEALLRVEALKGEGLPGRLALRRLVDSLEARGDDEALLALPKALKARMADDDGMALALLGAQSGSVRDGKDLDAAIALASRLALKRAPGAPLGVADARLHVLSRKKSPPYQGPSLAEFAWGLVEPGALAVLDAAYPVSDDEGGPPLALVLLRARALVAEREYHSAVLAYRSLPGDDDAARLAHLLGEGAAQDALLSEAGRAWLAGGAEAEGAEAFAALAATPTATTAGKAQALLAAARCAQAAKNESAARALFRDCHAGAPAGKIKDAAAWHLADAISRNEGPRKAAEELIRTMPGWSDPGYFSDVLSSVISGLVRLRAFGHLESLGIALRARGGSGLEDRIGYIIMRSSRLGLHAPSPAGKELERKAYSAQLSYYSIMASALEGREILPPLLAEARNAPDGSPAPSAPAAPPSSSAPPATSAPPTSSGAAHGDEALALIELLIEYGLPSEIPALGAELMDSVPVDDLRALSSRLSAMDRFWEGLRVAVRVTSRKGREAKPVDYRLLYPRAFGAEIDSAAAEWGLDPYLLLGLVRTESAFDPKAVSRSGARGLAQLMPETAAGLASPLRMEGFDLHEPEDNLTLGAAYLAQLERRAGGDRLLATLCYNGGPTRVMRMRSASPSLPSDLFLESIEMAETRDYGKKVLAAAAIYGYLIEGREFADSVAAYVPGFPIRPAN